MENKKKLIPAPIDRKNVYDDFDFLHYGNFVESAKRNSILFFVDDSPWKIDWFFGYHKFTVKCLGDKKSYEYTKSEVISRLSECRKQDLETNDTNIFLDFEVLDDQIKCAYYFKEESIKEAYVEYDWVAIELDIKDEYKRLKKEECACDPDDERNPYTLRCFVLEDILECFGKGDLGKAFELIVEEYGVEFFKEYEL